ncbi:MAG: hypothetical protein JW768_07555 [Chitinispirillaceae bacterium]|nr:hypothetical protein [Chitinispirillaceae bacterium]
MIALRFTPFALFALAAITLRCANVLDGSGSTTESARVVGTLYQPDGKTPAAGVRVFIRPRATLADTSGGLFKQTVDTASVLTDTSGRFAFDSTLDTGTYVIEAASGNDAVLIDSVAVTSQDSTDTMPPDTLKPAGAIKGIIHLSEGGDPRKVFVLAFGIDRFAKVEADGRFRFQNLAEAAYDLRIISSLDNYGVLDTANVTVRSADTTDLDTIALPFEGIPTPKGLTLTYDTLRQIVTLTWNQADTALVTGYNVYRQHQDSGLVKINSAPITDTTYGDSTAQQDQTYTYQVKALDKAGNEGLLSVGISVRVVSAFELTDTLGAGTFQGYQRIAIAPAGRLYVADIVDPGWSLYVYGADLALQKSIDSIAAKYPYDLDVDSTGNIYLMNQDGIVLLDSTGLPIDTLTDFANNENKQFVLSDSAIFFTSGIVGKYDLATETIETTAMISADGLVVLRDTLYVGGQTNMLRTFDKGLNPGREWTLTFVNDELPRLLHTDELGRLYVFGYHFNPNAFTTLIYSPDLELLSELTLPSNANGLEVTGNRLFIATTAGILVYE